MDTLEFLKAVWPTRGAYAVCSPFYVEKDKKTVYPATLYGSIEEVVQHVRLARGKKDLFFNVHTLIEFRKKGARKQENMRSARVFFFDLDCGDGKDYETQKDAVDAIVAFRKQVGLPKPLLVSSGRGVHVYFRMSRELNSSPEWLAGAYKLKSLADHFGLKYDPSRVTDTSSLLRIPGSQHFKDPTNPLPVEVKAEGEEIDTDDMLDIIEGMFEKHKLSMRPSLSKPRSKLAGNLHRNVFDGPPTAWQDIEKACPQIARQIFLQGDVSQPEWFFGMGVLRHATDGEQMCHDLFNGAASYNPEMTDLKLAQLSAFGPTTCDKLADVCGPANCGLCKYKGLVTSPIVAGRRLGQLEAVVGAPPPNIVPDADPDDDDPPINEDGLIAPFVDAPWPFKRIKAGISMSIKEEGAKIALPKIICRYDLFPTRHLAKTEAEGAQVEWCVNLPMEGQKTFVMPLSILGDNNALGVFLSQEAILLEQDNLKFVRKYMLAYLQELQQLRKLQRQNDHLGWTDDEFILQDVVLHPDGTETTSVLSQIAASAKTIMGRAGTLEKQIEALHFYNEPKYVQHQFAVGCSLGSILLSATTQHGVLVNLSGESGASKSSALFASAGLWGDPEKYVQNGTKNGATKNMRDELVITLSNLPFIMDEITELEPAEVRSLAFGITQVNGKGRLMSNSTIKAPRSGKKALIAITTANTALQALLALENAASDAGAMRVFEMNCVKVDKKLKPVADKFLRKIMTNYGHIGPLFAAFTTKHKERIFKRVRKVMAELDAELEAEGAERFWTAAAACALVACEIAFAHGWFAFDVVAMRKWLVEEQFPTMRGVVRVEHEIYDPVNMFSTFVNQHLDQICIVAHTVKGMHQKQTSTVLQHARGRMVGHVNLDKRQMHIATATFNQWCTSRSKSGRKIMQDLYRQKVVTSTNHKFTLGEGTEQAMGRTLCFVVDMSHAEIGMDAIEQLATARSNVVSFPTKK